MAAGGARVRFGVIGVDHVHAFGQVALLEQAGAELAAWQSADSPLTEGFAKAFAAAPRRAECRELLEDGTISLVVTAAVPDQRAEIAVQAMRHGKDVLVDKPGAVTRSELARLREVQRETGRRWVVYFSERFASAATVRALELVREGAIGSVFHVIGIGPHLLGLTPRPDWFYQRERTGGILADLASHQVDQFLAFTGSTSAQIVAAQVGNRGHPEHPGLEDFGELLLRADEATGYARVDWFTPAGLGTWGDVRLLLLGTGGTLEVRKNCDLAGREGGDHLFFSDAHGSHHLSCAGHPLPFGPALLDDVRQRTETAVSQEHCFTVTELALRAQEEAQSLDAPRS